MRKCGERPILFSSQMVRAILAGAKTQTRRVILPVQPRDDGRWPAGRDPVPDCPYGRPGDRLWVRETHRVRSDRILYAASDERPFLGWTPSTHMPRWASRITLAITDVRVERLQEISEDDAKAEGVGGYVVGEGPVTRDALASEPGYWHPKFYRDGFRYAWDELNFRRGYSWQSNPWCWCLSFTRIKEGRGLSQSDPGVDLSGGGAQDQAAAPDTRRA